MHVNTNRKLKCHRPIDATALFWCVVVLLVAWFTWLVDMPVAARWCLITAPFFVAWQIWSWVVDIRISRGAIEWCGRHYPDLQSGELYSFINSVGRDAGGKLDHLHPETPLLDLDWFAKSSDSRFFDDDVSHKHWLEFMLDDAGIQGVKISNMGGKTLGDAVILITRSQDSG